MGKLNTKPFCSSITVNRRGHSRVMKLSTWLSTCIPNAFGQRQARRVVLDHRGQVSVDQAGHAGTIAGIRQLRPGAGRKRDGDKQVCFHTTVIYRRSPAADGRSSKTG
jgi:hypothetical protein